MAKLLRWAWSSVRKAPSQPLRFPTSGFDIVPESVTLEEEKLDAFKTGCYYPANIGDVLASRYQIIGKLGFGVSSTVWLARDLEAHHHVALKVFTRGQESTENFKMYQSLGKGNRNHIGYPHVMGALDELVVPRHGGDHHCLVLKPMWDSFKDMLLRNPSHRFTQPLLKSGLIQILRALDYLHTECKIIHTDIKADNILQTIEDSSILDMFTDAELNHPSPRKTIEGVTVYASRSFELPKVFGRAVLSDFGSAVSGVRLQGYDAQPNVYRSPEVMLKSPWSYPIDIWNVGVMIWDLFEGKHMFYGNDPDGKGYSTRAHLAEVIGLLGLPPLDLLQRGKRSHEFFDEDGRWRAEVDIPEGASLETSEENLEGESKRLFLEFMRKMLQWRPEDRKTAKELLKDPWLTSESRGDEY